MAGGPGRAAGRAPRLAARTMPHERADLDPPRPAHGGPRPGRFAQGQPAPGRGRARGTAALWLARPAGLPPHRRAARNDQALDLLRSIGRVARSPADPLVLALDDSAGKAFNAFLAGLHGLV